MDKNKKYSISEVSEITGYDKHVLRYYEDDFNLEIPRTKSNRRYYTYKEIETFLYIKELQEKGLSNKQIKLVLECPEILIRRDKNDLAVSDQTNSLQKSSIIYSNVMEKISIEITNVIAENMTNGWEETRKEIINYFEQAVDSKESTQDSEVSEADNKEKDILLCENARLKMKVKEKSYEVVRLKEKINHLSQKNTPFWKRIFLSS